MYYELYIDVLFLENLMMDSLLLLSVRKIQKLPIGYLRVFVGAVAGAILTCIVILLNLPIFLKYVIFYVFITVIMVLVGLKQRKIFLVLRSSVLLYVIAIFYGGIMYFIRPFIREVSLFYTTAVVVYFVVNLFWKILNGAVKQHKNVCKVTIFTTKGMFQLQALEDTGNGLTDPVTGDPVCVIADETARYILGVQNNMCDEKTSESQYENRVRYIVYRTIAGENIMPVVRAKEMIIYAEEKKVIQKPLIGICKEPVSERHLYQMLLNPDILGGAKNVSKNSNATEVSV